MIIQDAVPPYTSRCMTCGLSWEPEPAKSGPQKGRHTEASLNRDAQNHRCKEADDD